MHAAAASGTPIDAGSLLEMLTINAARAMGCAEDLGSLEAGKRADLVIRRADVPDSQPGLEPTFQLAVLSRGTSVHTVIADGEIVLRDGRPTRVDPSAVYADVAASIARMTARLGLGHAGRGPDRVVT
jgi:cytosine/adenosine deaminase-related metal-dependent hydrolase